MEPSFNLQAPLLSWQACHRRWFVKAPSRSSPDLQPVIRVLHFSPLQAPRPKPPVTSSFSGLHNTLHLLLAPFFTAKQISSHFVTAIEMSPHAFTISSLIFKPNKGFHATKCQFLLLSDHQQMIVKYMYLRVSYGENINKTSQAIGFSLRMVFGQP